MPPPLSGTTSASMRIHVPEQRAFLSRATNAFVRKANVSVKPGELRRLSFCGPARERALVRQWRRGASNRLIGAIFREEFALGAQPMLFGATVFPAVLEIYFVCALLDFFTCRLFLFLVFHGAVLGPFSILSYLLNLIRQHVRDNTAFPVREAELLRPIEGMRRRL